MNIDIAGRIRPSFRAEGAENLLIEGQKLAANSRGPYLNFKTLHRQDATNQDLFQSSVDDLLDFYLAGFNVCLFVMGESESGKTYTLAGEGTSKGGLVPMVFDAMFGRLQGERFMADTRVKRQNPVISLEMFEVYNELIKDLLQVPSGQSVYLDIGDTAEKGSYVKNAATYSLKDASDGVSYFRQGLARRTEKSTDYGPAQKNAATILHIDLQVHVGENPVPNKSRFTIVELPGLEKLSDDPSLLRQREGPTLSKALIALNQVVTSLSSNPYPNRVINYSESKLTRLLTTELGGNCKSRAILCLKPNSRPDTLGPILNFTTRLAQVKNFPVVNDSYAQNLLTQYQAKIIDLQQQAGVGPAPLGARMTTGGNVEESIRRLETENLQIKDENERLRTRMDSMQQKFGNLAHTKTDLSQELLLTEEEKLRLSQSLVEMQIENNKIREEAEATKFELTNKILLLENELLETQNERDKSVRSARNAKERLAEMEKDRKDLADEYVVLKTNYLALVREHEKETARNEELSVELLNLVNTKAALMKQVAVLNNSDGFTTSEADREVDRVKAMNARNEELSVELLNLVNTKAALMKQVAVLNNSDGFTTSEADREVDRVKAMVIQKSTGRIKADEILGNQRDRESVEHTLFANKKKYETELDRIRREHVEESNTLERQMNDMKKELQDARNLARERQQKISELNAALIMARNDKETLEVQNNRMQHKVKDLGEDFRMRLIKYVEDIADYMDNGSGMPDARREKKMKQYVENMLKDITMSHKEREDQLSRAAQQYREGKRHFMHKYEELLVHYRNLRQTCESRGFDPMDLGPDEHNLKMTDSEVNSAHLREINRLKMDRDNMTAKMDGFRNKYGLNDDFKDLHILKPGEKPPESWAALRKQLREFTLNTQRQLEDERTKLLTENSVLKEQLHECQNYIDSHLARYKQEIVKLRKMLGYDTEDGSLLTDRSNYKNRSRRH